MLKSYLLHHLEQVLKGVKGDQLAAQVLKRLDMSSGVISNLSATVFITSHVFYMHK